MFFISSFQYLQNFPCKELLELFPKEVAGVQSLFMCRFLDLRIEMGKYFLSCLSFEGKSRKALWMHEIIELVVFNFLAYTVDPFFIASKKGGKDCRHLIKKTGIFSVKVLFYKFSSIHKTESGNTIRIIKFLCKI